MNTQDANKAAIEALAGYMEALYSHAYEVVQQHWEAVKAQERKTPGWGNSSNLHLRCALSGQSLRIDWCGVKWIGSHKVGNRRMLRISIPKPHGTYAYNLQKLYAHAKEWEKPLVKETEDKLSEIRREASHVIKALRAIRNASKVSAAVKDKRAKEQ